MATPRRVFGLADAAFRRRAVGAIVLVVSSGVLFGQLAGSVGTPAVSAYTARAVPRVLLHNIPPSPNFLSGCAASAVSTFCLGQEVEAIDNARAQEGVAPINIRLAAWRRLSSPQQLFVLANLERNARGLSPAVAMTAQLDRVAAIGAANTNDPILTGWTLTSGKHVVTWSSNWAGGVSGLEADYFWMYSDGRGGYNVDCTAASSSGCWQHRENILMPMQANACGGATPKLVMGAAVTSAAQYAPSESEIFAEECGGVPKDVVFTWSRAVRLLQLRL